MEEVASRKTRPEARLVRRSKAQAPVGFNRQRQWRLKAIWLVQPKPVEVIHFLKISLMMMDTNRRLQGNGLLAKIGVLHDYP